jgi:two-component system, OmpR family, osmolarity sensor histidine kinase EnvZ
MLFRWLKRFTPYGLYGRAALILIVPIVTIQLVVSIVFIQRYFSDITEQMARSLVLEIRHVDAAIRAAPSKEEGFRKAEIIAAQLELWVRPVAGGAAVSDRLFYDFSGIVLDRVLREGVPGIRGVMLSDLRRVELQIDNPKGSYILSFDRSRISARNPHQLLVYLAATGILMTVIAFLFLRNQLRPIRRLAQVADAFGKGRTLPYRIAGANEVRAAGAAFLDMRARIERQIEQRTLLLSGVSHDLRTPLTRLKLGLAMLGDDPEVAALERDVDDMRRMLDGFLAFARSDATDEAALPTDPANIARQAVDDARRGGADVRLGRIEGAGLAQLRIGAVRRALDNLINNAVTYGKHAEVSVTIFERSVRFVVEDAGPGIPEGRREEAQKAFTRLDAARNQDRSSGVGLGLAITADIARSHGGALRLEHSERLGGLKAVLVLAR